jgi:(p)ppGpp synthase/HD superfamily hydrolase
VTAVLHDLLEDTDTTVNELAAARFSQAVIDAVVALTRCPEQTYEEYIEVVAQNRLARVVKLADLADNLANNRQLPSTPEVQERILRYERAIERLRASGGELPDVSDR